MIGLPADALPAAVAAEMQQTVYLVFIEPLDPVVKPRLRVAFAVRGQRIVDPLRPAFFLECLQKQLLIRGPPAVEPLHENSSEPEFSVVESWFWWRGGISTDASLLARGTKGDRHSLLA